jgi:hypothetical protein
MKTEFYIANPRGVEVTKEITLSLDDWDDLRRQLANDGVAGKLQMSIAKMLRAFAEYAPPIGAAKTNRVPATRTDEPRKSGRKPKRSEGFFAEANAIIERVASEHGVTPENIRDNTKFPAHVTARYEAIKAVAERFPAISPTAIARVFGMHYDRVFTALRKAAEANEAPNEPETTRPSAAENVTKVALSVPEFCHRYGIGTTAAYAEMKAGRLIARKAGRRTLIRVEDAERWFTGLRGKDGSGAPFPQHSMEG